MRGYFHDMERIHPAEAERLGEGGKAEPCRMSSFAVAKRTRRLGESAALRSLAGAIPLTAPAGVSREAIEKVTV
jgi:hypothetical protein